MASSPLKITDVCNDTHCNNDFHINLTDFYSAEYYRDIIASLTPLSLWEEWKSVDVTIMDIFNIPLATDEWICDFIRKRFHIDLDSRVWVEEMNELFQDSKERYMERYLQRLPVKIQKLEFKNKQAVINFIKETKNNKRTGYINCALAKFAYAVDDVLSNEKVRREHFLDEKFISTYFKFQIDEEYEDKYGNIFKVGKFVSSDKIIKFKIIARQKWVNSIIWKQLSDPKYYSIDEFQDLVWVTIYVENDYEAALMMQYIDQRIYEWKAKIKNKNWLDLDAVKSNVYLNQEFYLKLEKETKREKEFPTAVSEDEKEFIELQEARNERVEETPNERANEGRKNTSAENYREIKLVWDVMLPYWESSKSSTKLVWAEIKFVIGGHDNEKWLSLQTVYDYMKRFRELTRMWIPIQKMDIVNYVNDFFENIDENLKKKNKEKYGYYKELFEDLRELWFIEAGNVLNGNIPNNEKILALWLYKYFISKLKRVKLWNSKHTFYVDERILALRDIGLYKKELVELEKKDES